MGNHDGHPALPFDVAKTQSQVMMGAVEAVRMSPLRATTSTWLLPEDPG